MACHQIGNKVAVKGYASSILVVAVLQDELLPVFSLNAGIHCRLKGDDMRIRVILFVTVASVVFAAPTIVAAQQQPPVKSKKGTQVKDGCPRTFEKCVSNGVKMGNSSADASAYCSRNNNGC
jgi:hypothetical protein